MMDRKVVEIKRQIVIGDVHGCFEELKLLLEKVKYNSQHDELIFLGDLINKGPQSVEVLKFVKKGNHRSIVGNHELGFLRAQVDESFLNKGFLKLTEELGSDLEEYVEWIKSLPLYIEEDNFIAIHGGLEPGVALSDQDPRIATRIRTWDGKGEDLNDESNPAWYELYKGEKLILFGHWAARGLVVKENVIGLDTGCVWGGELSCLILPEKKIESVRALKMYRDPLK